MNIIPFKDHEGNPLSTYFLMAILFMIVVMVLWMIGNDKPVPETLAIPFSMIVSYLLGVKTPESKDTDGNSTK